MKQAGKLDTKQPDLFVQMVPESLGQDVIEIISTTNPNVTYKVDTVNGRCSCPAWKFQRGGERKPCKHLRAMGFNAVLPNTRNML
jgi:predicted nucleic acid-binding Zn finger protein